MSKIKVITCCAMFCALCFVSTLLIIIPLPNGYVNAGDVFVLLSGWCMGYIGIVSASIGSALADILSGYTFYSPATFVIKGLVALVCYTIYLITKKAIKKDKFDFLLRAISAICAEIVMVVGYFLFETALYGVAGGILSVLGNLMQGGFCAVLATLVVSVLYKVKYFSSIFPKLKITEI